MKIHARAMSVEPVSGVRADPNNPDSQLWIHMTAWHSAIYAYETYGPGPLSPEDEARYWEFSKVLRAAISATLPHWQRHLANLRQPRIVDALIDPLMRPGFRIAAASPRLQLLILRLISPATVSVAGPMILGLEPERKETLTPAEAFDRHGIPTPAELYEELQGGPDLSLVYTPSAPAAA